MRKISSVLYTVGLVISSLVGLLHFFAPYVTEWYSYIPDAPLEIYASIDYVNFFFSLLLTGLSLILLVFKKKIYQGSREVFVFYAFLVFTWFCRVLITIVIPWPTPLQKWLIVGFLSEFMIVFIPAIYLFNYKKSAR
ncbi:hypothetical protein [Bacillus sp. B-jedd]|uniref:hypothetical protein n=1 Tax=Bacillus sp. B-jedd TaxID=1476857 RepID=UPI00051572C5|nr:hypothetical protein [Bacillus sp. B-jedd]CEG25451.1 hypothetical protein BN1002_00262 [Bacillus sp. B-jedd]